MNPATLEPHTVFPAQIGDFTVQHLLGRGKSGYSYLVTGPDGPAVLKLMHQEPVPYYAFTANKVHLEVTAYHRLLELGVAIPTLLEHNEDQHYLLKTYVNGAVASDVIAAGALRTETVHDLLAWSRRLHHAGHNLDWFPANFVIAPEGVVYVDYEINPHDHQWGFEQWGVYYWANPTGMRSFLKTGDANHINQDPERGLPRTDAAIEAQVRHWLG